MLNCLIIYNFYNSTPQKNKKKWLPWLRGYQLSYRALDQYIFTDK